MSTPRHSEAATKAALSIALQYLPTADRKARGEIAGIIDRCILMHGPRPESAPVHYEESFLPPTEENT